MELVSPSTTYKKSFLKAVEEYQQERISFRDARYDLVDLDLTMLSRNFNFYIKKLAEASQGKGLPPGYVAHTPYWLIDNGEFIGRVDIRHILTEQLLQEGGHIGYDIRPAKRYQGYGKKILELALPKAKELGITKVLITCDETNIGSKKIIEANGGVFENSVSLGPDRPRKLRYWIENS